MKTIDRHLTQRLLYATVGASIALILLFTVIDLLTHRRIEIIEHDVPIITVGLYYILLIPKILVEDYIAALSILVATLLVLGTAAQNNEFTALLACGVPLRRIARVPLLLAAAFSLLLFALSETLGPLAARQSRAIEEQYFGKQTQGSFSQRSSVSWANLDGGWTCHIEKFNRVALTGEGLLMLALKEPDRQQMVRAERIYWDEEEAHWIIEDGIWSIFYPQRGMAVNVRRITQAPAPLQETPEELFAPFQDPTTLSAAGLRTVILRASQRGMPVSRLQVDFHSKFSKPALPLVIVWLAIPFAARLKRGGISFGFGLSVALALVYLVLFSACQSLGYTGRLSPFLAAWLANFIFLVAGAILVARMPT